MNPTAKDPVQNGVESVQRVIIRFAGDSGDGMQVTGNQFTNTSAILGNDVSTFPDFPSEIRAPAGSLAGVSGFQISFASMDIHTPGDQPDALVAMNPAALRMNVQDLKVNAILIINTDLFTPKNIQLAGYEKSPLDDHSLDGYRTIEVPLTTLTRKALEKLDLPRKTVDRCKNFFALGMMYYLYNQSSDTTVAWLKKKFQNRPELAEANRLAIQGGRAYCEATHVFQTTYRVEKAEFPPGKYRNINGNTAMALGLTAAGHRSRLPVFLSTYPITPASDILHEMAKHKRHGVLTIQVEDEIAAICQAIGGAFAGMLAVTTTSGPGMALKSEAMGLAVMAELPLVIVNIQRGGPSTGLPTKTEQADLLQAAYGRHGEAPIPIISARSPGHCFWAAMEGARIAIQYMTPVIILSDGYLANGAEPWKIPSPDELPGIPVKLRTDPEGFRPFDRDPESLARPWAIPGTPGLEHRIGGLEKEDGSGNVSHDPANHQKMVQLRAEKVARIQDSIPDAEVVGDRTGKLLIVSWGSTYGAICGALRRGAENGLQVSHVHVDYLFPFPKNLEELLKGFDKILVPELNLGQLAHMLRAEFLIDVKQYNKVQGKPFKSSEILDAIHRTLEDGE